MWSSGLEDLKKLNTSDSEVAQLVMVKQARLSDEACVALVAAAHERKHPFTSGDSTANLASAGYSEEQILEIARADQLDAISGDAVAFALSVCPTTSYNLFCTAACKSNRCSALRKSRA